MAPAKIIMTLWVVWKNPVKLLIKLDAEDAENTQDLDDGATGDIYYERIEMPFNSLMTKFFDASNINDLMERMLHTLRHRLKIVNFPRVVLHWIK